MKHFSQHDIDAWLPNLNSLFQRERPAAPFPGRFPTRVYMQFENEFRMGKPSANLWQWFLSRENRPEDLAYDMRKKVYVEFDRNGPICAWMQDPHKRMVRPASFFDAVLWNQYHPALPRTVSAAAQWL